MQDRANLVAGCWSLAKQVSGVSVSGVRIWAFAAPKGLRSRKRVACFGLRVSIFVMRVPRCGLQVANRFHFGLGPAMSSPRRARDGTCRRRSSRFNPFSYSTQLYLFRFRGRGRVRGRFGQTELLSSELNPRNTAET